MIYDLILRCFSSFLAPKRELFLPERPTHPVVWIHGVSVGEIKAAASLIEALKEKYPSCFFFVTTTTRTGLAEARRILPFANGFSQLPLDISSVMRHWVQTLCPALFLLMESDFWPHLLEELKSLDCPTVLISGKISLKSAKRFRRFSFFSKRIFSNFDLLLFQTEEQKRRFEGFVSNKPMEVTGNLKCAMKKETVDCSFWQQRCHFNRPILTIASTHFPEEKLLLERLPTEKFSIFLIPRHPERFEEVAGYLKKNNISFCRWSELTKTKKEQLILVDAMGQVPVCYSLSDLVIVGGSFVPGIGGHNVLEPLLYQKPVIFGPYMETQKEMVEQIKERRLGEQVTIEQLQEKCEDFLNKGIQEEYHQKIAEWDLTRFAPLTKTLQALEGKNLLKNLRP